MVQEYEKQGLWSTCFFCYVVLSMYVHTYIHTYLLFCLHVNAVSIYVTVGATNKARLH